MSNNSKMQARKGKSMDAREFQAALDEIKNKPGVDDLVKIRRSMLPALELTKRVRTMERFSVPQVRVASTTNPR